MNIPVVFEDNWFLIVDKPAGLLTQPTPRNETRTLTSILNDHAREKKLQHNFFPCHRLDRQTSGLIIYAKTKSVEAKMADLFRQRKVSKEYIAFVQGKLSRKSGRISSPIEGKDALTNYRVLQERKDYSVVEVSPVTGRTNQIRIHLKSIGHPLVGEDRFSFRKDFTLRFKRVCLHAKYLEFKHPETGKAVVVKTVLPLDMQKFLEEH